MSHLLKVIFIFLSQSKYWNVKSRSMSQSKVKENAKTITIQQGFCYLPIVHLLRIILSLGCKVFISASPRMQ